MKTHKQRTVELDEKELDTWRRIEALEGRLDTGKLDAEMARVQSSILKHRIKTFEVSAGRERLHRKSPSGNEETAKPKRAKAA